MASGFLKRGMSYLGLIDDEYDDERVAAAREDPDVPAGSHQLGEEEGALPPRMVQAVDPALPQTGPDVTVITPRVRRATSTELSPHVHAVTPRHFAEAAHIANSVMVNEPVIVNLQLASRELKRRMIDFCSGVTYALGAGMERVADSVFLITPSSVELSAAQRQAGRN